MRYLCVLGLLFLCSCEHSKPADTTASAFGGPQSCTQTGTGVYDLRGWGSTQATAYDCAVAEAPKMNCQFFHTDSGHREIQCVNPAGIDQDLKSSCKAVISGAREFLSTGRTFASTPNLVADGYDCGVHYNLWCFYFRHDPDGTDPALYEDVQCVDNQF